MFDEVGYYLTMINCQVSDYPICSIPPLRFKDIQNKKIKITFFIFVYSMIKNVMSINEKFIGLTLKLTSKSISALLKLKFIKMNLLSIKISRKRKNTLFFPPRRF
jgi:hypothetical protein